MEFIIEVFTDGAESVGLQEIISGWRNAWEESYTSAASLEFLSHQDLKQSQNRTDLPPALGYLEQVRNPDVYFFERSTNTELGGVEITDHSPDGSNIEKRYPFIWASRRVHTNSLQRAVTSNCAQVGKLTASLFVTPNGTLPFSTSGILELSMNLAIFTSSSL